MDLLLLLLFSIPVFYILGIIQLISWIFWKKSQKNTVSDRGKVADYLKVIITELEVVVKEDPNKTVKQQLEV